MFNNKSIFITGETGNLGKYFVTTILQKYHPKKIIIYSHNELKQFEIAHKFNNKSMCYFIGAIKDLSQLSKAMDGVDYVVHATALKHVPIAEYNPLEESLQQ